MKYLIILIFISQFLFSAELTRKIMISSFKTLDDAQYALKKFNENKSEQFDKLQNELNFKVIARPSDNLYVLVIEAFKDYTQAKIVLNEINNQHPDAYINKYIATKEDNSSNTIPMLFNEKNIDNKKELKEKEIIKDNKSFADFEKEEKKEYIASEIKEEILNTNKNLNNENEEPKEEKEKTINSSKYSFILYSNKNIQDRVKRNLSIYPLIKDSSIIKIEYKDSTAQRSSEFVNQLLLTYLSQNQDENTKQLKESLTFLEDQLEKAKDELSLAEKELESFRSENLLFNIDRKVDQVNKQRDDLQVELLSVTRKNKIFNSIKESLLKGESISSTSFDDEALNDLIKQLNEQRSIQQELATKYTPAYAKMKSLAEKISGLEEGIIKNVKNIEVSFNESINGLEMQIQNLDKEILRLPNVALELSKLERIYNLKESVYEALLLKYNDSTSNFISSKRVNRVIDYAQEPEFPVKP